MEKLLAIQTKLNAPKTQTNSFGKYKYRNVEDILAGLKPLLEATKTAVRMEDEVKQLGNILYIEATATLFDAETGDAISEAKASAGIETNKKGMDLSQTFGAASSYARKYALGGLLAVDDSKLEASYDPDAQPPQRTQEKPQAETPAKAKLRREIQNAGEDADAFARRFGFNDFTDLNEEDAKEALGNFGNVMKAFKASKEEIPF